MVKITNPLGDVKIGRQGEVVYQRKYGEQMRRTASPKGGIPSQRQLEHRALYRAALNWRSQLSLANRRYLDGYCLSNWVVDAYKSPLTWSRFALKLYLEKVKFVITDQWTEKTEAELTQFEHYIEGDNTFLSIYDITWYGQTFTPQQGHTIKKIKTKMYRKGYPGTATISIRATDGEGKPTGADLCAQTFNANNLTSVPPGQFYEFDLGDGAWLDPDVIYAEVLRAPSGVLNDEIRRRVDTTGAYARGYVVRSFTSGSTWTKREAQDFMFEEWGFPPDIEIEKATLHVRHPALLTVVHKRGGLPINGYDTLSSLDEEYLTGQVGLDVEVGDEILATTLPGIEYKHQVL